MMNKKYFKYLEYANNLIQFQDIEIASIALRHKFPELDRIKSREIVKLWLGDTIK